LEINQGYTTMHGQSIIKIPKYEMNTHRHTHTHTHKQIH